MQSKSTNYSRAIMIETKVETKSIWKIFVGKLSSLTGRESWINQIQKIRLCKRGSFLNISMKRRMSVVKSRRLRQIAVKAATRVCVTQYFESRCNTIQIQSLDAFLSHTFVH